MTLAEQKAEFITRFKAHMLKLLGEKDDVGKEQANVTSSHQ